MKFLSLLVFSFYCIHCPALTEGEEKIQGYYKHAEQQDSFDKERVKGLAEFLKSKEVDQAEWEKKRLQYVEERKKEIAHSVSSETGPYFKEYLKEKSKFDDEKSHAYQEFQKDNDKIKTESNSKKMLAFQLKELGLDKNLDQNRVDPKKRKWGNTSSSGSQRGGTSGGGFGGSPGYIPPSNYGGPPNDGMDDMDQQGSPDFEDGEGGMPVPPVPPPID
jgi:hypothetical protein